MANKEEYNKR